MKNVSVIGQGYVGLPLAVAAAQSGYEVTGIDINLDKIETLAKGISFVEDISNETIRELLQSGRYYPTNTFESIVKADIIVICVPTPLNEMHQPDISYISTAISEILKYLNRSSLVILESTVAPGTTRSLIAKNISSNLKITDEELLVAYSPERIDPLNKTWNIANTNKIISGVNRQSLYRATQFYKAFTSRLHQCDSLEIAETAKLMENSFRLVNISLVNELSRFCSAIDIDVNKVLDAASTKPYGFMRFSPSVGVGGHCIPVDPIYLSNAGRDSGAPIELIDLAFKINQELPRYFITRAKNILGSLQEKRILILGVAYKPNVADVRETAVKPLIELLVAEGAIVFWHDDLVKIWNGETSTDVSSNFDLAILATPHDYLNLEGLGEVPLLNTRGSL